MPISKRRRARIGCEEADAREILALFPAALRIVAGVMERGKSRHPGDWRAFSAAFHLERARRHLDLLERGEDSEPHLQHAACRLLMALESRPRVSE